MIRWGWSGMSHDAALAVMNDEAVVYASHGERYSRVKNDKNLHQDQINEALEFGEPDEIYYYETPWLKKLRQFQAGQHDLIWKQSPRSYMKQFGINKKHHTSRHHHSHVAYGYFTSSFASAEILVIDSIGEFDTTTWWTGYANDPLHKRASISYPDSIGLWYSAMTQRLGLKPQEHEYILMGMAAVGDPNRFHNLIVEDFFHLMPTQERFDVKFKRNLHRGCMDWRPDLNTVQDLADIAAAVQDIYEELFVALLAYIRRRSYSQNLVMVGGCALNCVANRLALSRFDNVWIPPNPGDAGSSIGAIAAHTNGRMFTNNVYLGTDIPGDWPIDNVIDDLLTHGVSAVASGRAEFGPRALGNRSILADPRLPDVKDRVNKLKQRESFRPFAPAILAREAHRHFIIPDALRNVPYMQYAFPIKYAYRNDFPGIVHVDDTSRIQTVSMHAAGFSDFLEEWYRRTGCPMVLNTSLNIKGEPLVNTLEDAKRWSQEHGVTVRTPK